MRQTWSTDHHFMKSIIPKTSATLLKELGDHVDSARWGEFIARYEPMMRAYLQIHFPKVEADDILQETFMALMKTLPNYRYQPQETGHFRNYLTGIVRNRALQYCRQQARREKLLESYGELQEEEGEGSQESVHADILEIALQQLLADERLSAQNKQIFIRVAVNHERPAEVAARFGLTRNNVDQIKNRLVKRLKELAQALEALL